jgi:hypothetical protein
VGVGTYLDVALHFEMIQDWRSAHVEYVLATRYDIQIDCAWYKLAVIYLFGLNVVKIDEPLALDMTLLAIKLGSHAASSLYANYGLGHTYTTKHADHRAGIVTTTTDPGKSPSSYVWQKKNRHIINVGLTFFLVLTLIFC